MAHYLEENLLMRNILNSNVSGKDPNNQKVEGMKLRPLPWTGNGFDHIS